MSLHKYSAEMKLQCLADLSKALLENDDENAALSIDAIQRMLDGVCFCSAHSESECCCGAWY